MKDLLKKFKETIGIESDDNETTPIAVAAEKPPKAGVSVIHPEKSNKSQPMQPVIEKVETIHAKQGFPPAPQKREEITRFIINALRPYVDEKNTGITGLDLYVHCVSPEERELTEVALYSSQPGRFQQDELERKLRNHYISMPAGWKLGIYITAAPLPDCRIQQGKLGLNIITPAKEIITPAKGQLKVLNGQTFETTYLLDATEKQTYYIGRGKQPTLASGKVHQNDIAFINRDEDGFDATIGAANSFVSRNHAIIRSAEGKFFLYADKGGLPESGNKTKLLKADNRIERLDIDGVAHELQNGDQIELGGEARLIFSSIN